MAPVGASLVAAPAASAWATANVTITGHGWGHGRGMGQWGAYGYATSGQTSAWILDHFYGGTVDSVYATQQPIGVRLMGQDGADLYVTSGGGLTVGGVVSVPPGGVARVYYSGGQFFVSTADGCSSSDYGPPTAIADPTVTAAVAEPGNNIAVMLTLCSGTTYRGQLRLAYDGTQHTVNVVLMEWYLYGVVPRESPASWANATGGINALRAQAVAARSYAWAENRYSYARTCDTTSCQVYSGAAYNGTFLEDPRTTQAVGETDGHVRIFSGGGIARTEFSSSTGGYSAGGTFPAVVDDGDNVSPYHNWSVDIPASTIGNAYGVGTLTEMTVLTRNGLGADGGRVLSIRISGSAGSVTTTGNGVAATLGLRSNWFSITNPPPPPPPPAPSSERWFLRNTPTTGNPDAVFSYGIAGDVPMMCDWFGIGRATPGVKRGDQWYLSKSPTGATIDAAFVWGNPGDTPLCGDWDGNGTETPAVWRAGTFYFSNAFGVTVLARTYGGSTDIPIVGRWFGGPYSLIGYVHSGVFHLSGSNIVPADQQSFVYGNPGDTPVVGDWDGNGSETIGVRRGITWYLADDPASGAANRAFLYGDPTDTPLAGRFAGGLVAGIGVARAA